MYGDLLYLYSQLTEGLVLKRVLYKDRLDLAMIGMIFPRNHRLYEIFDRKFQQMFVGGLVDRYVSVYTRGLDAKMYAHLYEPVPQMLTLEHLEAGFVVWLVSLSLGIFAFGCEWLTRIFNGYIFALILKKFNETQKIEGISQDLKVTTKVIRRHKDCEETKIALEDNNRIFNNQPPEIEAVDSGRRQEEISVLQPVDSNFDFFNDTANDRNTTRPSEIIEKAYDFNSLWNHKEIQTNSIKLKVQTLRRKKNQVDDREKRLDLNVETQGNSKHVVHVEVHEESVQGRDESNLNLKF